MKVEPNVPPMRRSTRYWLGQRPDVSTFATGTYLFPAGVLRKRGELLRSASELLSWARRGLLDGRAQRLTGSTPKSFNAAIRRFRGSGSDIYR